MQISDLMRQYNRSVSQGKPITSNKGVERLVSSTSDLAKGNIFEGTVSSVKGGRVTLALSNGQQISARLDGKLSLSAGQSMFFQVKSNDGNQVEIRPYMVDGTGGNLTLMQALKAAGLPIEANFLSMVNKMMEEQMPIDKASVSAMAKLVTDNPTINVNTIVQMQKLGIEISPEMASQFENYLEDKQAIGQAMDSFIDELGKAMINSDMPVEDMKALAGEVLTVITDDYQGEVLINQEQANELNNSLKALYPEMRVAFDGDGRPYLEMATMDEAEAVETIEGSQQPQEPETEAVSAIEGSQVAQEAEAEAVSVSEDGQVAQKAETEAVSGSEGGKLPQGTEAEAVSVSEDGQQPQESEPVALNRNAIITKSLTANQVLDLINQLITSDKPIDRDRLINLLSGRGFNQVLKAAIEQQWMVKPQNVSDSKQINQLYEHMEKQLMRLESVIKAAGGETTNISNLATDIRSNVEFMNQINEAYTYVQIPLKMSGQSASGELYVYTNKKKLAEKEGELSAFLHLDMDNLGSTDVSIKMMGKEVTTNFYMESDESYALVKQFLPQLEARLNAKGYNCKLIVTNEEKHVNFVDNFLKKDMPAAGKLHRYSFDMRA